MITKYYEKLIKFIKENIGFFFTLVFLVFFFCFPLPYYIHAPGGLVDVKNRFQVSNPYSTEGSFHLAYVSEYEATIPLYLFAKTKKEWTIEKKEEVVAPNETMAENDLRNHLLLKESNQNALLSAFLLAKKKVAITSQKLMVSYVDEKAKTKLKVGDQILKFNHQEVSNKQELLNQVKKKKENDLVVITILRNGKEKNVPTTLFKIGKEVKMGVIITVDYELESTPSVKFHFKQNESGPSGGFMMSLAIYNAITEKDISQGMKIAGTGTIDSDGKVGPIGGIEFKVKSANKEEADLFFAPSGENYEAAKKIAKKYQYNMKVIKIKTLQDAVSYLENYKH